MILGWLQLIGGLLILLAGGEFLVRSSVKLALHLNISSIVIGLTVVSFGTSFPELVVSVNAALDGHPDISLGNVVGSNIANLGLVLGLTAVLFPISVQRSSVVLHWPLMLLSTLLLILFSWDLMIEMWEALILVGCLIAYNILVIKVSGGNDVEEIEELETGIEKSYSGVIRTLIILLGSIALLIFGADLLVEGAVVVARSFGLEERIIAISVIAFGTSAPELATSLIAVYKKETSIGIGNLIGSNIFNILAILGITGIMHPIQVNSEILSFDLWWVLGIPLLITPFLLSRMKVSRMEGGVLVGMYFLYMYLIF
jgi:cation:H+ antiporter